MAIFQTTSPRGRKGGTFGGDTKTRASLAILVFQNSILILIMHYSRVMPTAYSHHRFFTSTAVFLTEVLKLAVSLTLCLYETSKTLAPSTPATVLFQQVWNAVFQGDGWKLVLPAAFHTLQNLLAYVAVGHMDAVHYQVLYQLKILSTALFSFFLLGKSLSSSRWLALIILTLGVSIVSLPASSPSSDQQAPSSSSHFLWSGITDHLFPRSLHELGQASLADEIPGAHLSKRSATYQGIDKDVHYDPNTNYSLGVSSVLIAATVSGLNGVYFEKILKQSPTQASVWIRNVQLSLYSMFATLIAGVMYEDGSDILEHGFFEGYNWVVWSLVCLQAVGGLVGNLVIRDNDNIVKNFATSVSIVISFVGGVWMFDFNVTKTFLFGTCLVLVSTYLYSSPSSLTNRPPPMSFASFEKPTIVAALTPRASPSLTDEQRLNLDPLEINGNRDENIQVAKSLLPPHMTSGAGATRRSFSDENGMLAVGGPGALSKGKSTSRPSSPLLQRPSSRIGNKDD